MFGVPTGTLCVGREIQRDKLDLKPGSSTINR